MPPLLQEAGEAHEREVRLLRELRDTAASDAARAQGALRDLQAAHDELMTRQRSSAQACHAELACTISDGPRSVRPEQLTA